jgi:serine/threonine protein kinase/Tfp pilus assembly protein PilF
MGHTMPNACKTEQERERQLREACDALERRIRAGESYRTEDCLATHPELAADSDASLELLYFEYVLREELGEAPRAEDWYLRFPEHQVSFEKILRIHNGTSELSRTGGLSPSRSTFPSSGTISVQKPALQRHLSKYELLEELGRGSMGVVYKAREPELDRLVALKVILAGPHAGADQIVRVHREARAIARLKHPNIVQIHEIGDDDGRPFLCMEYVDGPGLDQVLARWNGKGRLAVTPEAAARLMQTLAGAVHYAHQQGIIHRDLKPANILLQTATSVSEVERRDSALEIQLDTHGMRSAIPKIADFGLAKFLDSSGDTAQTGHLVGTPTFMAPEQADGRVHEVGPGVDIYALGVILYQLLTGRPPFQASTVQETLELVRTAEPTSPWQLQPHLPRDLQTICLKCLAKEPRSRYTSALALSEDLRRFLAGKPIAARPASVSDRLIKWTKRRPVVAGLIAGLILTVAAGGAGVIWEWQRAERNARAFKRERDKAFEQRGRAERHLASARKSIDELSTLGAQLRLQPQLHKTGEALLEKVLAFYQDVLQDESADPEVRLATAQVWGRVGHIRHELGQWDKAAEAFQQNSILLEGLLQQDPDSTLYRRQLGGALSSRAHVLRDQGKTQEAKEAYRRAAAMEEQVLATAPEDPTFQSSLSNILFNTTTVLSQQEEAAEKGQLYQRAIALIRSAQKSNPNETGYQAGLALYLEGLGMFQLECGQGALAEATSRASIDIRERLRKQGRVDRWTQRYLGRGYSNLGWIVAGCGRLDEAQTIYAQAGEILGKLYKDYPDWVICRNDLFHNRVRQSWVEENRGNYRKAETYYRQALHDDPKNGATNNELAWFLVTCPDAHLRNAREAVQLGKKAVELEPTDGNYLNTLGVAHYRDGDCKAAIDALQTSVKLRDGGNASDLFFLAMAHWKLGHRDEARNWFAKGVEQLKTRDAQNKSLQDFCTEAQALLGEAPTRGQPSNSPSLSK